MKTKQLTLYFALGLAALPAPAQQLKSDYISWPDGKSLAYYVNMWNSKMHVISPLEVWQDEEFFISRQKPHFTFRNTASQVDPSISAETDKCLIWWVPVGDSNRDGVHTDALPNGLYDSEAFSMWSYITHYGDWTSPHGWVPGALADVAHKNGVSVTGLASIPYGEISDEWRDALNSQTAVKAEDLGKFLHYHGVNGLAYNSEFSGFDPKGLISQHDGLTSYMAEVDPLFENIWYAGTSDRGSILFDIGVNSYNYKLFNGASYFLNYNWNRQNVIESSIAYAESMGRDPLRIYAGMNMQGHEPSYGSNWDLLSKYRYSIGLWGAHSCNMFWQDRGIDGSSAADRQRTYLHSCEQWFGNGRRNPAIHLPIETRRKHRPDENFFGMSAMMTARSALSWDLTEEPFVSCFNIGNGSYFNIDGKRVSDRQWYNIGIQDYMPTWRYWFAPHLLDGDVNEADVHLKADITWEDAWFGGSCLKISGTTTSEYLHLFKMAYNLEPNDTVSVTFKLMAGSGDATLCLSPIGDETNPADESKFKIIDESTPTGKWITVDFVIDQDLESLALAAFHFMATDHIEMLLGRFSITRGTYSTPQTPIIKKSKIFCSNHHGVDAKLRWTMADANPLPDPTYNQDIGVSMFKCMHKRKAQPPK